MKVASELSENLMRLDAAFQELASQRKTLDYTFADIDLYQILKVSAYMAVMLGAERDAEKRTTRKRGPNFGELLAAAKRRIFTAVPACPTALTHADNLFIAHSAPLRSSGVAGFNPLLDPLRAKLSERGETCVAAYYDCDERPLQGAQTPAVSLKRVADWSYAAANRRARTPGDPITRQSHQLIAALNQTSSLKNASLNNAVTASALAMRAHATHLLSGWFENVFKEQERPTRIFITNSYTPAGWAAIRAARRTSRLSVDVQHGVQGRGHYAYNWTECEQTPPGMLADAFLCWDDVSAEFLTSQPWHVGRARVAGLPMHHSHRYLNQTEDTRSTPILADHAGATGSTIRIGLFLQYRQDADWCRRFVSAATADGGVEIWLRRHPGAREMNALRIEELGPNVRSADALPLADMLQAIDSAVTGYSSVAIEAVLSNTPVVIASEIGDRILGPYLRAAAVPHAIVGPAPEQAAQLALELARSVTQSKAARFAAATTLNATHDARAADDDALEKLASAVTWLETLSPREAVPQDAPHDNRGSKRS